jgi:hypothetical protein
VLKTELRSTGGFETGASAPSSTTEKQSVEKSVVEEVAAPSSTTENSVVEEVAQQPSRNHQEES